MFALLIIVLAIILVIGNEKEREIAKKWFFGLILTGIGVILILIGIADNGLLGDLLGGMYIAAGLIILFYGLMELRRSFRKLKKLRKKKHSYWLSGVK